MRSITVAALLLLAVSSCTTSTPTDTPGVTIEGNRLVWYEGPEIEVEVYYGMMEDRLGEPEAILRLGIASNSGSVGVPISGFQLFDPSGRAVAPLVGADFREAHTRIRMTLDRYAAWWGPTNRFLASRQRCDRWYVYPPVGGGEGFVADRHDFENVYVSGFRVCGGPMVFPAPGGVQPGRWVLRIELEESVARIPFEVEDPEAEY